MMRCPNARPLWDLVPVDACVVSRWDPNARPSWEGEAEAAVPRTNRVLADDVGQADPVLLNFIQRVSLTKKALGQFAAMLEARDAPTIYNVWLR